MPTPRIAEFSLGAESFALGETLSACPEVDVSVEQLAGHSPKYTMPCLWAAGDDLGAFDESIADDPTVQEVLATAEYDHEHLFHVQWSDRIEELVTEMVDREGVILDATGSADGWRLRIRFMTQDQFRDFQEHFEERGPRFTLVQVFTARHPRHVRGDVSPVQEEALRIALQMGYFEVPRDASLLDIAEELGISDQAVSERLRRGTEQVVRDVVDHEPPDEEA